jgi:hypothetical protein
VNVAPAVLVHVFWGYPVDAGSASPFPAEFVGVDLKRYGEKTPGWSPLSQGK